MTRVALSVAALLTVSSAVAAPVPKAAKKPDDAKSLEGRWQIVTLDTGAGSQVPTGDTATFYMVIKDGKLNTGTAGGPGYVDREFRIDPSQHPKHLDVSDTAGRYHLGIYELDGDTLKECETTSRDVRPTEFKGGGGNNYIVWKRVKE